MELVPLFEGELRYRTLHSVDFEVGRQFYGTLDGTISGERMRGRLELTNLAAQRPDNVNCPALRGLLTLEDESVAYVEMNGLSTLRESDQARVFVTSLTFRSGDQRWTWLNTVVGTLEGVLDTATVDGRSRFRAFECWPTVE